VAGVLAHAPLRVSSATPLPSGLLPLIEGDLAALRVEAIAVENDADFAAWALEQKPARIRLVGGDVRALSAALGGAPDVAIYSGAVTAAGRIELLPFLREQAVSITAHRFGNPDQAFLRLAV
jgi:RHH-type proline utilization regulon transcriptional repressor/proline dehydrogenase/delta 1-pyrroline-5-carboxylate dehydrogenase